jgi:hypothetical protein
MKYSDHEARLLALIPADGSEISSRRLADLMYGDDPPINAPQRTMAAINAVALKAARLREGFIIKKSTRRGPHPVQVWREPIHPAP